MSDIVKRTFQIALAYQEVLGRLPNAQELQNHIENRGSLQSIHALLDNSSEAHKIATARDMTAEHIRAMAGKRSRVLIFGAYGNGNAGDAVQPTFIRKAIQAQCDAEVFAYSLLDNAPYVYPPELALQHQHLPLHPKVLSLFDALVIGGGGLFAHPHDPLWNPLWAQTIPIPYAILGCGVENPLSKNCAALFARASLISVRDSLSMESVVALATNPVICPDPFLAGVTPSSCYAVSRPYRTAYILRGPVGSLHSQLRSSLGSNDIVISMEPAIDYPLAEVFARITFVTSMDELVSVLSNCDRVITQRYHGAIAALKLGKPMAALTTGDNNESKLMELFSQLGLQDWCRRSPDFPAWETFTTTTYEPFLSQSRRLFESAVTRMLRTFSLISESS